MTVDSETIRQQLRARVNFPKLQRQVAASVAVLDNPNKKAMVERLGKAYEALEKNQAEAARQELMKLETIAKNVFKWPGDGAELPHPLSKRHLERAYLTASTLAGRKPPTARKGKPREFEKTW